jgi:hypothetical protein
MENQNMIKSPITVDIIDDRSVLKIEDFYLQFPDGIIEITQFGNLMYKFGFKMANKTNEIVENEIVENEKTAHLESLSVPEGWIDWNKLTLDQAVNWLRKRFMFESSGDARTVYMLIDFYDKYKNL